MVTPHQVAAALRGDGNDIELMIDVTKAITSLPSDQQELLRWYARGCSPKASARRAGLKGNAQRAYERALRTLTQLLNGGETCGE